MSTFDTTGGPHQFDEERRFEEDPLASGPDGIDEPVDEGLDTLDLLEQAAEQKAKAEAEIKPEVVDIPGVGLRLLCETNIPSKRLTSWQRKALPPRLRNVSEVSPLAMDQAIFNSTVLVNTCTAVQVLRKGGQADNEADWRTVTDTDGEVCTLASKPVWEKLKVLDSATAVKKLFPRDAELLRAGQQVLDAAGWTQAVIFGDEEYEDPTS
jgi:hypothetical protein